MICARGVLVVQRLSCVTNASVAASSGTAIRSYCAPSLDIWVGIRPKESPVTGEGPQSWPSTVIQVERSPLLDGGAESARSDRNRMALS